MLAPSNRTHGREAEIRVGLGRELDRRVEGIDGIGTVSREEQKSTGDGCAGR